MTAIPRHSGMPFVRVHDLSASDFAAAMRAREAALDTETTGLDWRHDELATCQLYVPRYGVVIVQVQGRARAPLLCRLLESPRVRKIFHYALFDLCFLGATWPLRPAHVVCTKTASRILAPNKSHTLQALLSAHLHVVVDKAASVRESDWQRRRLSGAQLRYAADDVRHLIRLYKRLERELAMAGLLALATRCFGFIPDRVRLELLGAGDVFRY